MILPSKELLSEALNYNVNIIDDTTNNEIIYNDGLYINIYELQHKMKEWLISQNISIDISLDKEMAIVSLFNDITATFKLIREIVAPTEFEAVTQACEWLLENKDKLC